jgi:HEAT repeat protein
MLGLAAAVFAAAHAVPAASAVAASPLASAAVQIPFEQAIRDLTSPDTGTRLRAAQMLKAAAYPEAAVPLAPLITDAQDDVQLAAIAAELNIFRAEKVVLRTRLGFVIEKRNPIAADAAFSAGLLALGPRPVPAEVLTALRAAARDDNPRVGLEALYTFGTLAMQPTGAARFDVLRTSGPDLASMLGAQDPALRFAAVRVLGSVFERRRGDPPVDELVGDAVITSLNDTDRTIRAAAMQTLGAMRYERAVQGLTDVFQHAGKSEAAEAALDAIARIARPYSSALLSAQLSNRIAALRGIAMEGLGRIGDRTKSGEIDAALKSERNEGVLLAGSFAATLLAGAAITPIGDALTKPKLQDQARAYLVELAPGRASLFTHYAQDPDPQVRADVADIFSLAGDATALPMLEPLARDTDPQVAGAAARAIARLRGLQSRPVS